MEDSSGRPFGSYTEHILPEILQLYYVRGPLRAERGLQ